MITFLGQGLKEYILYQINSWYKKTFFSMFSVVLPVFLNFSYHLNRSTNCNKRNSNRKRL